MSNPFILSHIRRLPLVANCTPDQLDALGDAFQQVAYRAGDTLYRQGENSHALYLFIAGIGHVMRTGSDRVDRVQGEVKPGEYVGESSLFNAGPRDVSVVAIQDSGVLVLTRERLDALFQVRPDIRAALSSRPDPRVVPPTPAALQPQRAAPPAPQPAAPSPRPTYEPPIQQTFTQPAPEQGYAQAPPAQRSFGQLSPEQGYPQAPPGQPNYQAVQQPQFPAAAPAYNQRPSGMPQGLAAGETVLLNTRRHPWMFVSKALRALLLAVILLGIALLSSRLPASLQLIPLTLCGIGVALPTLLALFYYFDWNNDFFLITDQRVVHQEHHLLSGRMQREEILYNSIQNVNVIRTGLLADVLGFGDLVITEAGSQQPLVLDRLPNAQAVQKLVFDQIQKWGARGMPAAQGGQGAAYPPQSYRRSDTGGILPQMQSAQGGRIVYRKHWIVLLARVWKPLLGYLLLFVLISIRLFVKNDVVDSVTPSVALTIIFLWLALDSFWMLWGYIAWREDVYILDDTSITDITRAPFGFREERRQAGLRQVQNVTSEVHSLFGSFLNEGDVIVQTAAEQGQLVFHNVADPARVAGEVLRRARQYESQYRY